MNALAKLMADVATGQVEMPKTDDGKARAAARRFTRLTNGFGKKPENLGHAVARHFMYCNLTHYRQVGG